jgi:hypothetical protein
VSARNRGGGDVVTVMAPNGRFDAYSTEFSGVYNPYDGSYMGGTFTSYVYVH